MKLLRITFFVLMGMTLGGLNAQTPVISDFEDLSLPADTFYNGSDLAGSFTSGSILFPSVYNSSYGGYWESGFAYSTMRDSTDGTYVNMYSARPATGADATQTYGIGQQGSRFIISGSSGLCSLSGMYITNGTYDDYSMSNGDMFAKKFGGTTGDDPDWFKLTVKGYLNGTLKSDSVVFYLADYRFTDNDQDYIVRDWQWVPLESLGRVDSVAFFLSSSDNGAYGMNTPPFFFFDEVEVYHWSPDGLNESAVQEANIYPNPASNVVYLDLSDAAFSTVEVLDLDGRVLSSGRLSGSTTQYIDISGFADGMYLLRLSGAENRLVRPIVKKSE